MYQIRMKAYEGVGDYIFVSYAHKDADFVLPIIDNLYDLGYRIWFDDGIEASAEWPVFIEDHLSRSHAVLAFITKDFVKSHNCRKEITYALNNQIPIICVMPESIELGKGLDLQLADQQQIDLSSMKAEKFYQKITEVAAFEDCRWKQADGTIAKTHKSLQTRKRKQKSKKAVKKIGVFLAVAIAAAVALFVMAAIYDQVVYPGENTATNMEEEHVWMADASGACYCTDCGVQTGELEGEQMELVGTWTEQQITLGDSNTLYFIPKVTVEDCIKLTMNINFNEVEGDPYGTHHLYIKDEDKNWRIVAEFETTEQMAEETVAVPITFESPISFIGICPVYADEKDADYSFIYDVVFTDVEVIRQDEGK